MAQIPKNLTHTHPPAAYRIQLQGQLDQSWSAWFDNMNITVDKDEDGLAVTTLTGLVPDQPALHGLLSRIRDLGLTINTVQRIKNPIDK